MEYKQAYKNNKRLKVKYFNTSTMLYTLWNNTIKPFVYTIMALPILYILVLLYTV